MTTRLGYNKCKSQNDAAQTQSEFDYTFFSPKYSYHESYRAKNQSCHLPDDMLTDIENELRRLDQKASKCGGRDVGSNTCMADGSCDRKTGFTPARLKDREIAWTNLKRPSGTGL